MKAIYFVGSTDTRDEIFISEPENKFSKEDFVDISALMALHGKQYQYPIETTDNSLCNLRIKTYKGNWKRIKVKCIQIVIRTDNIEMTNDVERYTVISFIFFIEQEKDSKELAQSIIEKMVRFAESNNFKINEPSKQELEKSLPDIIKKITKKKVYSIVASLLIVGVLLSILIALIAKLLRG